jgi:hypothetical protein
MTLLQIPLTADTRRLRAGLGGTVRRLSAGEPPPVSPRILHRETPPRLALPIPADWTDTQRLNAKEITQ